MKKFLISMLMLFITNLLFANWYYGEVKINGRPLIHQFAKDKYKKEYFVGIGKVIVDTGSRQYDEYFLFVKNSLGDLTDDIVIKIDNNKKWYPLNPSIYTKQVGIADTLLKEMKAGKQMKIIISQNEGNPIYVDLKGFTKAISKIEKLYD